MLLVILLISLLRLLLPAASTGAETRAACGEDVALKCPVATSNNIDFLALTWYKITNGPAYGIIRITEDREESFNFSREARFGKMHSLLLPKVSMDDSGTYECKISAKVGGQNKRDTVTLTVPECTPVELTTQTKTSLSSNQTFSNSQVEIPYYWSLAGFLSLAAFKILMAIFTIKVMRTLWLKRQRSRLYR